ncbi:MAG: hypothetical protein H6728_04050 [Myxococcales bacterium]|nr:hypothetical protein [Myxococcales bacterium]
MSELHTNRDLYLAIHGLRDSLTKERSLEEYLSALLALSSKHEEEKTFSVEALWQLLQGALTAEPQPFEEAWREQYEHRTEESAGYATWKETLLRQIVDLHEMAEEGMLENESRYFGMSAPRGAYWFNFDIPAYLECAMAGSFGGWEQGDDTGRLLVPGPVAVFGEDGEVKTVNPEEIKRPVFPMEMVSWEDFEDFLVCGQVYE